MLWYFLTKYRHFNKKLKTELKWQVAVAGYNLYYGTITIKM